MQGSAESSEVKNAEPGKDATGFTRTPHFHSGEGPKMSVVVCHESAELMNHLRDWEDLASHALEPNVFYESWFLVPAIEAFAGRRNLEFLLIFARDPAFPSEPPILCGFFPLDRQRRYKGFPVTALCLWRHIHCYLCTPLLRSGYARECLVAFFNWLAEEAHGCNLMEFGLINGDGPFHQLLVDHFSNNRMSTCITECYTRALFRPADDAEQYVRTALSVKHRKKIERQEARLTESGRVEYRILEAGGNVEAWTEEFLELEASGWKGRAGSALACDEVNRTFFMTIAKAAFNRGRSLMLALHFNGRPIAHRCSLLAEPGSFAFKVAFAEEYARFSPGALLHLENIRRLHDRPEIRWMDSCTHPNNFMLNRLWPDRRTILSLVVGTGRSSGDLVVTLIPPLRWLKRTLSFRKSTASP